MITRRELVKSTLFFGLGAACSGLSLHYLRAPHNKQNLDPQGSIWTLGEGSAGFTSDSHHSTLSVINLSSSSVEQRAVPLKFGHHVLALDSERMLCVGYKANRLPVIDRRTLNIVGYIEVPDKDLGFSGHGHVLKQTLYLPCLSLSDGYKKGGVQSYNLSNLEPKNFIETAYPYPHDVTSSNGDLFISYNDIGLKDGPYTYDGLKTAILRFKVDSKTGNAIFEKEYPSSNKLAAFSHIDADPYGNIYISSAQMIRSLYDRSTLRAHLEAQSLESFPVTSTEYRKDRFSLDSPILKLNSSTGEMQTIQLGLKKQRRPLSTQFNPYNGHTYVTCPHSNTLIEIPKNPNDARAISALHLGISGIQGVCCINGGKQMAIGGIDRGVAVFDTQSLETKLVFDTALNISTHLTYWPSA